MQNNTRQHNSNSKIFRNWSKLNKQPANLPTNINITYINNDFNSSAETGRKLNVRLLNVLRGPKSKNTNSASKQQEKPRLPPQTHDDQETQTSCTLSSKPVIQKMQRELVSLRKTITKKMKRLHILKEN